MLTLSTCMAFIKSTRPSKEVFRISGGVCWGKVSLKWAEEYNLQHTPRPQLLNACNSVTNAQGTDNTSCRNKPSCMQ